LLSNLHDGLDDVAATHDVDGQPLAAFSQALARAMK
jgi:hypothetical protein